MQARETRRDETRIGHNRKIIKARFVVLVNPIYRLLATCNKRHTLLAVCPQIGWGIHFIATARLFYFCREFPYVPRWFEKPAWLFSEFRVFMLINTPCREYLAKLLFDRFYFFLQVISWGRFYPAKKCVEDKSRVHYMCRPFSLPVRVAFHFHGA